MFDIIKNWKLNWKLPKNQFSFFQMDVFVHGCTRRIKDNLISRSVAFWNKIKIEKRKTKGFFKNIQIKIENYKLKKKRPFSIFNFEMKLKYTKMYFSIPILKWKFNGTLSARIRIIFHFSNLTIELKKEKRKKNIFKSILI